MTKKLSENMFNKIYSKVPRLCVDLVIKEKKGILLTKRDIPKCKGMWHLPGGTLYINEKIEKAAKRIAKYETGLKIQINKFLGIKEYSKRSTFWHTISVVYLVKPIGKNLKGSKEGKDVRYFKKIPKNTIKDQKEILLMYLKLRS